MRHQPRLEQSLQRAVRGGLCADRRRVRAGAGEAVRVRLLRAHARSSGHEIVQSKLMPAIFATARHFSVSATMKSAKSLGEPGLACAPTFARLSRRAGGLCPSLMAPLSFSTISAGVPAGATTPDQNVMT